MPNHNLHSISETYGEILPQSLRACLSELKLSNNDIFVDLGSGQGKAACQVFMETPVKKSIGIEINPDYHQMALQNQAWLQKHFPAYFAKSRILHFEQGDFQDTHFEEATVILLGSPCFSPSLLKKIASSLNRLTDLHTLLTLKPIPWLTHLKFTQIRKLQCSWDAALCYIYKVIQ